MITAGLITKALATEPNQTLDPDSCFKGISIDSRTLKAGELFIAIRGERFDGHDYLTQAQDAGATACIIERSQAARIKELSVPTFVVEDSVQAYRRIAGAWRQRFDIPIIAVAGSVGKSSVKEIIAALLRAHYQDPTDPVLATHGSENGFLGIAITLGKLRKHHRVAVIEIGIDKVGAMRQHAQLVQPSMAVITTIAAEHLEGLGDIDTVCREECSLLAEVTAAEGQGVVPASDDWIASFIETLPAMQQSRIQRSNSIAPQAISGLALAGEHRRHNLGLAFKSLELLGIEQSNQLMRAALELHPLPGRGDIRQTPDGVNLLCDHYNASPASMHSAMQTLSELAPEPNTRWILCLADMLELGEQSEVLHRELTTHIAALRPLHVFLLGTDMRVLVDALQQHALACTHTRNHAHLIDALRTLLRPEDWVLIKGSRGMHLEIVIDALMHHAH